MRITCKYLKRRNALEGTARKGFFFEAKSGLLVGNITQYPGRPAVGLRNASPYRGQVGGLRKSKSFINRQFPRRAGVPQ